MAVWFDLELGEKNVRKSILFGLGSLLGFMAACHPVAPPDAPAAEEGQENKPPASEDAEAASVAAAKNEDSGSFESADEVNPLQVVQELAESLSQKWQSQKAAEQEVLFALKLVVQGRSAVLIGGGEGAVVKKGSDAAKQNADMTVTIPIGTAIDMKNGVISLHQALADNLVHTDNPQGLERFLSFVAE
ncbi:MAG: hypothetical protein MK135_12530 [Polyangiaceae bacterium]|nr:hypothetical protein [Polyangiaceae bacterium]